MSTNGEHVPYRRCHECRQVLPLDPKHFHRHCQHPGGFRSICRTCRSSIRKAGVEKKLHKAERTCVLAVAKLIRERKLYCPDALCAEVEAVFPGPARLARAIREVYDRAPPMAQASILIAVMRMTFEREQRRKDREEESMARLNRMSPEQMRAEAELIKTVVWETYLKDQLRREEDERLEGVEGT